jgi:Tfp pilus assembly major pilin PilA
VTDDREVGTAVPAVVRRDELTAAMMEASRAYREAHSFAAPLWAQSGLRSTYRASDHPVDLPFGFA